MPLFRADYTFAVVDDLLQESTVDLLTDVNSDGNRRIRQRLAERVALVCEYPVTPTFHQLTRIMTMNSLTTATCGLVRNPYDPATLAFIGTVLTDFLRDVR